VLTLLVAIVGVRAFGLGRAGLRWVERMTAHDAALRLAADLRVRVWRALAPQGLAPTGRRARRWPAWSATSAWCRTCRCASSPRRWSAGTVTRVTVGALALVSPAAAGAAAALLAATVALVLLAHRRVDAGAARAEAALRVAALRDTTTALEGAADLRAHGLAGRTAADLAALAADRTAADRARTRAGALGAGVVVLGTGLAAVAAAAAGAAAGVDRPGDRGARPRPAGPGRAAGRAGPALQRRGTLADARDRLDAVLTAPVPADPRRPAPRPRAGARRCRRRAWSPAGPAGRTCSAA
jgi:ATP-binding cassette subfamily C protein CydCD